MVVVFVVLLLLLVVVVLVVVFSVLQRVKSNTGLPSNNRFLQIYVFVLLAVQP